MTRQEKSGFCIAGVPQITVDVAVRESDITFTMRAIRKDDVPEAFRRCFGCGQFLPKTRWIINSTTKFPVCHKCNEDHD